MKINNKGYASTIIMFSILTLFLISMLMLVKTMNNSSTLNKRITEKVVDNIDYDASGTMQDRLTALENTVSSLKEEVINEIYPVGSIYMSTEDDTIEKVQSKFGGIWEKYAQGRTLIGEGTGTDSNGLVQTFTNGSMGGEYTHKLTITEMPSHSHGIGILSDGKLISGNVDYTLGRNITNRIGWSDTETMYGRVNSGYTQNVGGSNRHNNVEPYIVTYMYRKISN